jgi:hypothetical protein
MTFFGSRMMRGNETVNQSISASIDPGKLCCVSCDAEHPIVGKEPIVVLFSDQNFVPIITGVSKECLSVIRVENCSLLELYEVAIEIFGNANLPEGSVFLFGSVSYLGRSGTSIYARDWSEMVARCAGKWRGVRICPLIPLVVTECSGTVVRELSELTNWYNNVYDSDPLGFREVWLELVAAMEDCSTGATTLEVMDSYKVALPSTLTSTKLDRTITFCSNNSRPVVCNGLPKDRCCELLGSLLKFLFENFRACARPETYLGRADVTINQSEKNENNVTFVGASNLGYCMAHFSDPSLSAVGVTIAGWNPCPENINKMIAAVEEKAKVSTAFVFDLLGNSSVRYEQFDGTTSLPFKSNGRFHLAGKVTTTSPDIFKKVVQAITPIMKAVGNKPCIVLPPLPRYVYARCCNDSGHCTNAGDPEYQSFMMSGFVRLKNDLIKQLVHNGLSNFKVMDTCCVTAVPATAKIGERLAELKKVSSGDGVHFTAEGYKHMARRISECIKTLTGNPKTTKQKSYFWRGFRSRRGSSAVANAGGLHSQSAWNDGIPLRGGSRGRPRGGSSGRRPRGFHPYRKW